MTNTLQGPKKAGMMQAMKEQGKKDLVAQDKARGLEEDHKG